MWIDAVITTLALLGAAPQTQPALGSASSFADDPYVYWETFDKSAGLPSDKVFCATVAEDTVWVGTDAGLAAYRDGRWRRLGTGDGLPHRMVMSLAFDPKTGDLWVGTFGGLARLSAGRFDRFSQLNSGLANDVVYSVAVVRGKVWVATAAGTSRYNIADDEWSVFTEQNTPMHEIWCYSVAAGKDKTYVAVWGGGVLEYHERTDHWRDYTDPDREMEIDLFRNDGLTHDVVSAVAVGRDGLLWVGSYFGLSTYDGRFWRNYYEDDSPLVSNFINFIATRESAGWICTDRGLSVSDGKTWWNYRNDTETGKGRAIRHGADGSVRELPLHGRLPHNYILGIDFDGDDIWVATAGGLGHASRRKPIARTDVNRNWMGGENNPIAILED